MNRSTSSSDLENDDKNFEFDNEALYSFPHKLHSLTFKNDNITRKYIFKHLPKKSRSIKNICFQFAVRLIKLCFSNRINLTLLLVLVYLLSFPLQNFIYNSLFMTKPNYNNLENFFFSRINNSMKVNRMINFEPMLQKDLNFSGLYAKNSSNQTELTSYTFEVYSEEMSRIQSAFKKLFLDNQIVYQTCPRVPNTLKGFLNSTQVLQDAKLSNLVEFYNTINVNSPKPKRKHEKEAKPEIYVNKMIDKEKTREFWDLWNSNDIKLLNVSKDYYGHDGNRIEIGGHWKPNECISNYKIAIIIPYRDRLPHLKVLLYYLHLIMQRQLHDYRIFVVEPTTPLNVRFNKGRVMNAAFLEALKTDEKIDCFIFHDVDLVPEDDRTLYSCPPYPRHLSVGIDKFNYILPYDDLVGGVFAISREHYKLTNGYSNLFWGWGGEDDDLSVRIKAKKLRIERPPKQFSRYKMIRHQAQELNPNAIKTLKSSITRYSTDGVNTVNYKNFVKNKRKSLKQELKNDLKDKILDVSSLSTIYFF